MTAHEREAISLIEEYADNSQATSWGGIIKWIEINDTKAKISQGRVVKVSTWVLADGTPCKNRVNVDWAESCGCIHCGKSMSELSDDDQQKIVDIICDYTSDMEVYRPDRIREVLTMMADHALNCEEECELREYFDQIVNTGLFRDAVGKVVVSEESGKVIVSTSY